METLLSLIVAVALAQPIALSGGTVLDGTGAAPVKDAVVNIVDGKIHSIANKPVAGAKVVDVSGKWVVPGLIDAHVHFFQSANIYTRPDVVDLRHLRSYPDELAWIRRRLPFTLSRYLCAGVTSVADVGGPLETLSYTSDKLRIAASGPLLSNYAPPPLKTDDPAILKINSPKEGRAAANDLADKGADFIKLWMIDTGSLSSDLPNFRAAIEAAHARGLRVFAHATELATAKLAVKAGVDVLVHAIEDEPVDEEMLALLKRRDIPVIGTLVVDEGYRTVLAGKGSAKGIQARCGDPQVIVTWKELPRAVTRPLRQGSRVAARNLKRMADRGIRVVAGSDAGNIGTLHGPALHRELELLAEAGLTPAQILVSATRHAATILDPSPSFGTLQPGKAADVLVVGKDPLADVRNLAVIDSVYFGGSRWQN